MLPRGGTEILHDALLRYVDRGLLSQINLIVSECNPHLLSTERANILWQHVNIDQQVTQGLLDRAFVNTLYKIVFVSEWQKQKFNSHFNLSDSLSTVIHNATDYVPWIEKPRDTKLQLIYTSTPWRGLDVLLDAFELLNRNDVELIVYSSTVIYGIDFMKNQFDWLWDRCRRTRGVKYRGYAMNKAIIKALQSSHILAYPSIFEETSCLAAIEAGCSGCKVVTTDYGALKETCGDWATYVDYSSDKKTLAENYAKVLNIEIDNYWQNYDKLKKQHEYFNTKYSWWNRKHDWESFLKSL